MKTEHNDDFEKMLLLRQTGELPREDASRLSEALSHSPDLAKTEREFRRVVETYHATRPDVPVSAETLNRVVREADGARKARPAIPFPAVWLRVAVAACAACVLGWGILSLLPRAPSSIDMTDHAALERARTEVAFAAEVLLQSGDEYYWEDTGLDMADFVMLALPGEG